MLVCPKLNCLLTHTSCRTVFRTSISAAAYSSNRGDEFDGNSDGAGPPNLKIIFDALQGQSSPSSKDLDNAVRLDLLLTEENDPLGTKRYKNFPLSGFVTTDFEYKTYMVPQHSKTYNALANFRKTKQAEGRDQRQIDIVEHFGAVNHVRSILARKNFGQNKPNNNEMDVLAFLDNVHCIAHECPVLLKRDLHGSFPELYPKTNNDNLTVITVTGGNNDSEDVSIEAAENDTGFLPNLSEFTMAAEGICHYLQASGYWADFVEPVSRKLFSNSTNSLKNFQKTTVPPTTSTGAVNMADFNGLSVETVGECKVINGQKMPVYDNKKDKSEKEVGVVFTTAAIDSPIVQCIVNHAPQKTTPNEEEVKIGEKSQPELDQGDILVKKSQKTTLFVKEGL